MSQHDYPSVDVNGDEQFVTAIAPDHYHHSQSPSLLLKQPPNIYCSYPANYYHPAAVASSPAISSPEARMSVSGSSTGSYSVPHANLDPTIAYPEQTAVSAANAHTRPQPSPPPSRLEAGVITESYNKEGQVRSSWSARKSSSDGHNPRSLHDAQNTVTVYTSDKEEVSSREPNAVLVLLLLSAPIPLFSIGTAVYTFFALFIVTFTSPLRLCPPARFFRSTTFSTQLCQLLAPALRYHERLAQSSRSDHYHNNYHHHHRRNHHHTRDPYTPNRDSSTDQFAPLWSSLVLTLAPFLSLGLLLAVWTAAFFWIFAMILGNPDGTEKKDDGRVAVLGVNAWWQTWLRKSRKRQ